MLNLAVFLILLITKVATVVSVDCEIASDELHCNSFEDLKIILSTISFETITSLTIGDEESISNEMVTLSEDSLQSSGKLTLEILHHINDIKPGSFLSTNFNLEYFGVKSNNLTIIKSKAFSGLNLTTFDLIDNNIQQIEAKAFEDTKCENLDLSNNKLTHIIVNSLPKNLQELRLDHNNIFQIDENSLPSRLFVLNLNFNKITDCIKLNGLKTSNLLESVSLAFNQISECAQFPLLLELESFNITHNKLKFMQDSLFKNIPNVKYLYLGHNSIQNINLEKVSNLIELQIEFNLLHYLNLNNASKNLVNFTLIGNPFTCKCLDEIFNYSRTKNIKINYCKSDNNIPDCIAFGDNCSYFNDEEYEKFVKTKWYDNFLNKRKLSTCYK